MKLLAALILIVAALTVAWAALVRPQRHPLLIDASSRSGGAVKGGDAKLDAHACPARPPPPPMPGIPVLPSDAWRIA